MSPPVYNALAGKNGGPSAPVVKAAAPPKAAPPKAAPAAKSPAPRSGFNSKPSPQATGAMPALMGDKQRIARPPAQQIASSAGPAKTGEQRSGMETSMGALADQLHKPRR